MKFSVLLSVYFKEKTGNFARALTSIWHEQTLKPAQIVLVVDGPLTPELEEVVVFWKRGLEDVLTLVRLEQNVGLAKALNEGLKHCHYDLVARMDTDDIAKPTRFERQVSFMHSYPEIAASSAFIEEFDGFGSFVAVRRLPTCHDDIVSFAKKRSPLSHPASIFRKQAVLDVGGYPLFRNAQDYALWSLLIMNGYKLGNIPEVLLRMRTDSDMYSRRGYEYFKNELRLLEFQRGIGFLSPYGYIVNVLTRAVVRLSPSFVKKWLYLVAR